MKYKSIFIDTWGWLALGHRRDNYHQFVKERKWNANLTTDEDINIRKRRSSTSLRSRGSRT